ncbi:hypothetical protein BDV93DRAFT_529383 [Ceratobasidium sp. AG-I]|nr:hypothetical protein BDV93DRAFT_529383 [Ceratobasidium sp. AG-I]
MTSKVPNRSARGCMTCKHRRKKCDEVKPVCDRCVSGGFMCLGYGPREPKASSSKKPSTNVAPREATKGTSSAALRLRENMDPVAESISSLNSALPATAWFEEAGGSSGGPFNLERTKEQCSVIPRSFSIDSALFNQMLPLIKSQCVKFAYSALFQPFSVEEGLTLRFETSNITRWTMYISARIAQAILNGCRKHEYTSWIDAFHRRISESSEVTALEPEDLLARLSGLQDLYFCAVAVSGSSNGYFSFKKCAPVFLQLAASRPRYWSPNLTITIRRVLDIGEYDTSLFVFFDTMSSLAFSVPPLIDYDTSLGPVDEKETYPTVERIYGCPSFVVVLVARINSWRTSRWINQSNWNADDWREVEKALLNWDPAIEAEDGSPNHIGRLAVQESWRQAVRIYLYMGMCNVSSADPRVQSSVRQIVQLASTLEAGSTLERHFFMPCLIAGAAAQQEKHRAILRGKIQACQNEKIWILRGDDFALVLDHLWHGAGAGGQPTTWDDYANSRNVALPVDV